MRHDEKLKSLDYNWAKDEQFSRKTCDEILDIFNFVKKEREEREEQWQRYYRAWSVDLTETDKNYDGIADIHLPQIRKEVETMSRRIMKGMFPEDYIKAHSNVLANEELAQANTEIVRHYYDNVMKVKTSAMPWVKQAVLYGTSPVRSFWHVKQNRQFFRERKMVVDKEGIWKPSVKVVDREFKSYDAPVLRPESMFQTWVYPENVSRIQDLQMIFWRTKIRRSELEAKESQGTAYNIKPFIEDGKSHDQSFEEEQEKFSQFGTTGDLKAYGDDKLFDLLEVWMDLKLPKMDVAVPVVIEIVDWQYCTRIHRNPFWHQSPPFDFMRFILPPAGEFYGRGLPEATISVQNQMNDTLRQGMDSATLALNNITIVNPAFAPNSDSFEVEPHAIWWADPAGVKQFQFPDLTDTALKNMAMMRGIISEMSDNTPQLPDPIAGKARSTGQAELALNEFQTDLQIFLEQIGDESMNPLTHKVHSLLQQFLDPEELIRITPKYSKPWMHNVINAQDLAGQYTFQWLTATEIGNHTIKTQQMLNFVRVMLPLIQSLPPDKQIRINWENFSAKILRDGFNIRDIHNIIESSILDDSIDPDIEFKIVKNGGVIKVNASDDDQAHMARHMVNINDLKGWEKKVLENHINEHRQQYEKKQVAAQQQLAMLQMQMMSGEPQGQSGQSGNPTQIPESTTVDNLNRGQR